MCDFYQRAVFRQTFPFPQSVRGKPGEVNRAEPGKEISSCAGKIHQFSCSDFRKGLLHSGGNTWKIFPLFSVPDQVPQTELNSRKKGETTACVVQQFTQCAGGTPSEQGQSEKVSEKDLVSCWKNFKLQKALKFLKSSSTVPKKVTWLVLQSTGADT